MDMKIFLMRDIAEVACIRTRNAPIYREETKDMKHLRRPSQGLNFEPEVHKSSMPRVQVVLVCLLLYIAVTANSQSYQPVDAASSVTFTIRNLGLQVEGTFHGLSGRIVFDPASLEKNSINLSIDASTIDTGIELRNKHLRKKDYLDTEAYSRITFRASKISSGPMEKSWMVTGNLIIKNVTKQISFPFTAIEKEGNYYFSGQFSLNRQEFDVGGKSLTMSDEVNVHFTIVAEKLNEL
jgi:polyisoprenoid-binding protein YceI